MSTMMILLKSSDGHSFEVEEKIAIQFLPTIALKPEDDGANTEIHLDNLTSKTLALVIEYCKKHYVDDANHTSDEELKKWDEQFMQTGHSTIFDLINAANDLNIKSLFDLACQTVADMITGKTPDQVRALFDIENDFTPEEEEAIRRENPWAVEREDVSKPK